MTKNTTQFPIEIEVKVRQGKNVTEHKFKILGMFEAHERYDELDELPKTPGEFTDNWLASKMLCEKDGGRLPTMDELTIIAALIEREIIELPYGNFWSASESSSYTARARFIDSGNSYWYDYGRYSQYRALCLGDD